MEFCLSSRQTPEYLKQADQIKVASRDYNQIYDLLNDYPKAKIILNYQNIEEKIITELNTLAQNRLILCLLNLEDMPIAKKMGIPFYFSWPILTLEQLSTVKDLGVCYALISGEIAHQLHYTKIIGLPLRLIPNIAFLDGYPRENGVTGSWVRPEDLDTYSLYIDTIEFGSQPERREQALFRIYAHDKYWPGELGRIVQDLNYIGNNLTIDSQFSLKRMNCGMKCAYNNCTICYNLLKISDAIPKIYEAQEKKGE